MSETNTMSESVLHLLENFRLPDAGAEMEFSKEELADDMDGMPVSFQRVKMPSGGAVVFEMQSDNPEKPDYVPTLTGIIMHHHDANAYWPDGETADETVPPSCASNNGKTGFGVPGGMCEECALNEFGSGEEGKGKACKNKRHVYFMRDGDYLPLLLQLPPTSLRPFSDFVNTAFFFRRRASYGSLVELGLKKMDNGNQYSVTTFKRLGDFSGPKLAEIKGYAEGFKTQIKEHLSARREEPATEPLEIAYAPEAIAYAPQAIAYGADGQPFNPAADLSFGSPAVEQLAPDLPFNPPAQPQYVMAAAVQEDEDLPFDGPVQQPQPAVAVAYAAAVPGVINGETQQLPA